MVFDHRNKVYGAYRLREQTGSRYLRALGIVGGFFVSIGLVCGGMALYNHIVNARAMKEAEDALHKSPLT